MWGCGKGGRLGNEKEGNVLTPQPVKYFINQGLKVMNCGLGDNFNIVLTTTSNITVDEYKKCINDDIDVSISQKKYLFFIISSIFNLVILLHIFHLNIMVYFIIIIDFPYLYKECELKLPFELYNYFYIEMMIYHYNNIQVIF